MELEAEAAFAEPTHLRNSIHHIGMRDNTRLRAGRRGQRTLQRSKAYGRDAEGGVPYNSSGVDNASISFRVSFVAVMI